MNNVTRMTAWIVTAMLAAVSSANAICLYGGKHFEKSKYPDFNGALYAKTTLADEFLDASVVVRGTLLSSHNIGNEDSEEGWGTLYRVRVDRVFKGAPSKIIPYVSMRDSGGFYLGEGGDSSDYLLFLVPYPANKLVKKAAPGAYAVNYNCGQSREWRKVPVVDQQHLEKMASKLH